MKACACRIFVVLAALVAMAGCGGEQGATGGDAMAGWENGSAYNQVYDPAELDSIKGYYQESFEFSADGLAQGVGIVMEDRADGEPVKVHLGPKTFVAEDLKKFGLRRGQKIKVRGVWAEFDGEDVMMASKVKKGTYEQLKVRRSADGTPFWTMSAEMLAKERAEEFSE